jgi:hypothetical protein
MVVELEKALYGLIEAGLLWHKNMVTAMEEFGFQQNTKDPCVFNKMINGNQLTVCVYVDDFLCTCVDESSLDWLAEQLRVRFKDVTVKKGPVLSWVGQTFDFSQDGKVKVTMSHYVEELLKFSGVTGYAATPASESLYKIDEEAALLDDAARERFHSLTAKLLFMSKRTRPDFLTAVGFLTTRVMAPTVEDDGKLDRALKYLNATPTLGIVIQPSKGMQVLAYIDAAYGVRDDWKSQTGGFISLGRGPVFAKSAKQKPPKPSWSAFRTCSPKLFGRGIS